MLKFGSGEEEKRRVTDADLFFSSVKIHTDFRSFEKLIRIDSKKSAVCAEMCVVAL